MSGIEILKANGVREIFDSSKLISSLVRSGASPDIAESITDKIGATLEPGTTTQDIYRAAFAELKRKNKKSATVYSLRKAIMELGPTGFPFEDFFAEILKTKGYVTLLDQTVPGRIVPHEIDVIAYNNERLIMAEVKFHNDQGFKTDLKVALYVKARFDDLKETTFLYGRERLLDEGWLITNTKFTSQAITYANAQGIHLIGWNYPAKGNLQDLIEESKLHPLTSLSSLSRAQKKDLMARGFVLCRELIDIPAALDPLGLLPKKREAVLAEARTIMGI